MTDRITWYCDACSKPVEKGDGSLWVDSNAATDHMERNRRLQREADEVMERQGFVAYDVTDSTNLPKYAPWQVHHADCDPAPDTGYSFTISQIQKHRLLLARIAHVLEKPWAAEGTNLTALIYRALDDRESANPYGPPRTRKQRSTSTFSAELAVTSSTSSGQESLGASSRRPSNREAQ